ncbi:MAG: ribbon-helix-helix domain-containing protein [Staphylococcus equorum]|nr:ribbon-helix-helix domain-containing protein [Acinetobacter sp.]MDN5695824.1 ribbon-helix-helix domain-containing protein [Staphylococcus equorum]
MEKQRGQQLKIRFFDDVDHEKLKEIAEMEDRSLTYLVNQAIKQFLKNQESAKA